ncbi:alpha/beta fold hydrolase [Paenibacillus crassostreae]|uniref:Alpha/beta hydrolase n=1 Tax=Paenibacillus crassostreae TaxID=1763538 RepID=A0A167ETA6_9BACL|nr:alpha/beta hydrolase [Paenibacillus crassostreae]AOZ93488.1 alpha/beta hydrolase [Paenibacillus crassostreae]OAB75857.1 alpha/beta hydrolase [Paenibacillus crassostreae]
MEKIIYDGNTFCYKDQGQGDPLVLLHGFCGSTRYWDRVVPLLSDHYRCIVPDLRGHGYTDAPMGAYTIEQMADDVVHLIDELKISKVTLLGHSLGGYITLSFAERYASRLNGFGLIHSTAYPDSEEVKEKRLLTVSTVQTQGVSALIDNLVPTLFAPEHVQSIPEWINSAKEIGYRTPPQGAIGATGAMRERPDRRKVLSETELPVLLVAGEKDGIISPDRIFTVDKPNVTQVTIAGVGHMSMMEAPEQLVGHIISYLEKSK